jgi:hypothetical protein
MVSFLGLTYGGLYVEDVPMDDCPFLGVHG